MMGEEDNLSTISSDGQALDWAYQVYGDPLTFRSKLSTHLSPANLLSVEDAEALYLDWQTRETELGFNLLADRRTSLSEVMTAYGMAIMERRRELALTKLRLESMEQINESEPDVQLHYSPKAVQSLRREYNRQLREAQYLKRYSFSMAALDQILSTAAAPELARQQDYEIRFHLLGQAGRGYLRIAAFTRQFPELNYQLPELATVGGLTGLLVGQATISPTGNHNDILVEPQVANYLLHCLNVISLLFRQLEQQLTTSIPYNEESWPTLMVLLRAITELFFHCNFELPHANGHLLLDPEIPGKLLVYKAQDQQWQTIDEPANVRLRRETAQSARLLCQTPGLLGCQSPEEIEQLLKRAKDLPRANAPKYFEVCLTAGLAQFETDALSTINKFHVTHRFIDRLLDRVMEQAPALKQQFTSALGGPFQTLTAMALLDARLFNAPPLPEEDRFRWLARFWKTMGRRRPASLLGKQYAQEIETIMESLGEPSPERSTFLSIQLTSLFMRSSGIDRLDTTTAVDLLTDLSFTDQVRVVTLLNASWSFAEGMLAAIQSAGEPQEFELLLSQLTDRVIKHQPELTICFNRKWLQADLPIWRVMRTIAPHAWQWWRVMRDEPGWMVYAEQPTQGLSLLLRAFGDVIRLKLLFEVCSPQVAAQQSVEAETAARIMLSSLSRALMIGGSGSELMAETFSYYFNPAVLHDVMLAFADSFVHYLTAMDLDLGQGSANQRLQELLKLVINSLRVHFPGIELATADNREVTTVVPLGTTEGAQLELIETGKVMISKNGQIVTLDRAEWLELVRQIKAGLFAEIG